MELKPQIQGLQRKNSAYRRCGLWLFLKLFWNFWKIEAISWLLYDAKQLDEAVEKTNYLIRKLKATGKDESAQAAFEKLPDNAGDAILHLCELGELDDRQRIIVREYLSWSAYFIAKLAFDRWFTHYNKERPIEPKSQNSQHLTQRYSMWGLYFQKCLHQE